jgi:hypothetical protein
MNVLLVTFRLPGIGAADYRRMAGEAAAKIAAAPGLVSKTWLADQATNTYGGLVVFDSPAAAESYLTSQIIRDLRSNPRLTEFSVNRFDTLEAAGCLTHGLLPLPIDRPAKDRIARPISPAPRRRLLWRNHGPTVSLVAGSIDDEATWEDAAWQ